MAFDLRDDFITDRAAGAVNGTAAEPGPGTRVTVETALSAGITISSGVVNFPTRTGADTTGAGSCLYYADPITREPGLLIFSKVKSSNDTLNANSPVVGVFTATPVSSASYEQSIGIFQGDRNDLKFTGKLYPLTGTDFRDAVIILRSSGCYIFAKIDNKYVFIAGRSTPNTASLYVGILQRSDTYTSTSDTIRIPSTRWLPTPLASDGFSSAGITDGLGHAEGIAGGLGSGGSGKTWVGSTWSVSGGKAVNTPGTGSELVTDGDMELGSNWSNYGTPTTNEKNTVSPINGVRDLHIVTDEVNEGARQIISFTAGNFYRLTGTGRTAVGAVYLDFRDVSNNVAGYTLLPASNTTVSITGRIISSGDGQLYFKSGATAASEGYVDDVSLKQLTLSTLFSTIDQSTPETYQSVEVTRSSYFQAGLVACLDDAATPANFLIAYCDKTAGAGQYVKLDKCVGGTYTNLLNVAATYSAGATLVMRTRTVATGIEVYVWYNNVYIGTKTVTDAGIISNTIHGMFSTGEPTEVQLDDYFCYPTASDENSAKLDHLYLTGGSSRKMNIELGLND